METRINWMANEVGSKWARYIISSNKVITDSALPKEVQELVKIRASQINGCGGCLDMHTKDAAAAGESTVRINLVGAWRETPTRRGRTRRSTSTRIRSRPWWP